MYTPGRSPPIGSNFVHIASARSGFPACISARARENPIIASHPGPENGFSGDGSDSGHTAGKYPSTPSQPPCLASPDIPEIDRNRPPATYTPERRSTVTVAITNSLLRRYAAESMIQNTDATATPTPDTRGAMKQQSVATEAHASGRGNLEKILEMSEAREGRARRNSEIDDQTANQHAAALKKRSSHAA
ncbi:MAG: hypothetical protein C4529_09995 [Deltaproteobacteria bacterium]|nr:MAG: hypothetical protein C4529_09995 [Deltaproteobacteria bacterium]